MSKIVMFKGDDRTVQVTVLDENGAAKDIDGAAIVFTAKKIATQTSVDIQRKNSAAGGGPTEIEDTDLPNGIFKLLLVPANTESLVAGAYDYDFEITLNSKVYTILKGILSLKQDVTF